MSKTRLMIFLHQILSSLSIPFHNVRYHHPFLYTKSLRVIPLHYHPPYAIYRHVLVNFTPPISFLFHSIFSTTISLVQITFISCELYFLSSLSRHPPLLSLIRSHPLQLSFWNTKLIMSLPCLKCFHNFLLLLG